MRKKHKMSKEFNLSDKEIIASTYPNSEGKFRTSDVKKFIKRLKEELNDENKVEFNFKSDKIKAFEIIDKLAGYKLI